MKPDPYLFILRNLRGALGLGIPYVRNEVTDRVWSTIVLTTVDVRFTLAVSATGQLLQSFRIPRPFHFDF